MNPANRKDSQRSAGPRPCPICGARLPAAADHAPFCSERCRLVDLGRWFDARYKVSRAANPADLDDHRPAPSP